jgi:hypothetical protein
MRNQSRGVVAVLLALLSLHAVPALADPDDDEGWTPYEAPASSGTVLDPSTPEGGFGSPDRTRFDRDRRAGVLDQFCRHLDIQHEFGFNFISLSPDRRLDTYPDGSLAIIDDEGIQGSWNRPILTRVVADGAASVGLNFGVTVGGRSTVVRRLATQQSCDEVRRLLDFRDIKSVFPINADRITAMQLGELWRIPMTLSYSEGVGASGTKKVVPFLSLGRTDSGTTSMTLYRIAQDKVRFRFRIDHVVVTGPSIGVSTVFSAVEFWANSHGILLKLLGSALTSQINGDLVAWGQYARQDQHGARVLMEFIVDPTQPEEASALAEAVKGDFKQIIAMAGRMSTLQASDDKALKDYNQLREDHADRLGDPSYAASDEYKRKVKPFSLRLPFFVTYNSASLFGDDRVVRYTGDEGVFTYFLGDKTTEKQFLKMPWMGPLIKENSQKQVTAFTYAAPGAPQGDPEIVYIRNRGYLREPASAVRGTVEELNSFLNKTGAQRGVKSRIGFSVDSLVPPSPVQPRTPREYVKGQEESTESADRKGLISFTLAFDQKAVSDVIAASGEQVLKALAASAPATDRELAQWLAGHATVKNGEVAYDGKEAAKAFPTDPHSNLSDINQLRELSLKAATLISELASARDSKTNGEKSKILAKMISGEDPDRPWYRQAHHMAYEEVLAIVIQFVDPINLTGDFMANLSGGKDVPNVNVHLVLKKGRPDNKLLQDAGDAKARFAEPSVLID